MRLEEADRLSETVLARLDKNTACAKNSGRGPGIRSLVSGCDFSARDQRQMRIRRDVGQSPERTILLKKKGVLKGIALLRLPAGSGRRALAREADHCGLARGGGSKGVRRLSGAGNIRIQSDADLHPGIQPHDRDDMTAPQPLPHDSDTGRIDPSLGLQEGHGIAEILHLRLGIVSAPTKYDLNIMLGKAHGVINIDPLAEIDPRAAGA